MGDFKVGAIKHITADDKQISYTPKAKKRKFNIGEILANFSQVNHINTNIGSIDTNRATASWQK